MSENENDNSNGNSGQDGQGQGQSGSDGQGSGGSSGGNQDAKWFSGLPENYHKDPSVTRYSNLEDFVKSRHELEKKVGSNTVVVPDFEKATPEELTDFGKKLGVPDSPDGYKLSVPDGVTVSDEELKAFREDAHKALLTPKKANDLFSSLMERRKTEANQSHMQKDREFKERLEQSREALNAEWGPDNYEKNKKIGEYVIDNYGGDDVKKALNDAGLTEHPEFVKMLFKIGKQFSEGTLPEGPGKQGITVADAERKMTEMRRDVKGPFFNKMDPGHKAAIAEYEELNQLVQSAKASGTP